MILSVTEVETAAVVMVVQELLLVYCLLAPLENKVKSPFVLKMGNSGAVDIVNSWNGNSRMHHMDVHNYFLCELKDKGLLIIGLISGDNNDTDILMKT